MPKYTVVQISEHQDVFPDIEADSKDDAIAQVQDGMEPSYQETIYDGSTFVVTTNNT